MDYLTQIYNLQLQEIILVSLVSFLVAYYFRSLQTIKTLKESVSLVKSYKEQQAKSNELNKLQNQSFKLQELNNNLRVSNKKIEAEIRAFKIERQELKALQKIQAEVKNINQDKKKKEGSTGSTGTASSTGTTKNKSTNSTNNKALSSQVGEDMFLDLE